MERGGGGHTDQFAPFRIAPGAWVPPAGRLVELEVAGCRTAAAGTAA